MASYLLADVVHCCQPLGPMLTRKAHIDVISATAVRTGSGSMLGHHFLADRQPKPPTMRVSSPCPADYDSRRVSQILDRYRPDVRRFIEVCKDLHQNPELSCQESRTARIPAEHLRSLQFSVIDKLGGHGLVGCLDNGPGCSILLRADMDALPVQEKTGPALGKYPAHGRHRRGREAGNTADFDQGNRLSSSCSTDIS